MNILDNRKALESMKLTNGYNVVQPMSKVSNYIKIQKIKAKIRELYPYLCAEIYECFKRDGIDTLNRFTNHLESLSDKGINEIQKQLDELSLLEVIIIRLRLTKTKTYHTPIYIPPIFECIEINGTSVTTLEELLTLLASKQCYLYAPSVTKKSRKRDLLSFGYDPLRHIDRDFTLMRFLCLRGYKDLLIQKNLYP